MTKSDSKAVDKAVDDKKGDEQTKKIDIAVLEEDDDFEEFPAHASSGTRTTEKVSEWEDNWEDDIVDDEFTHQLRAEFEKQGKVFVVPEIPTLD